MQILFTHSIASRIMSHLDIVPKRGLYAIFQSAYMGRYRAMVIAKGMQGVAAILLVIQAALA
jgi:hypothetical protein